MADAAAIQQEMFETIQQRDFLHLRDLYHPEYAYLGADGTSGGIELGLAVAETYTGAFPDLTMTVEHQHVVSGDISIMEITATGTHLAELQGIEPTGRTVSVRVCNVVECKDGKVWREREYFDGLSLMQQLGIIPASGGEGVDPPQ